LVAKEPRAQPIGSTAKVSGKGLPDLLRDPGCGRMNGDVELDDTPPIMR